MSDDSKPYRSGPSIKTGDRVAFVDIDGECTEGIARVDSGLGSGFYHSPTRETRTTIIPDGEPWKYGRDYTLGDRHICDDTCSVGPFSPIPYDEMRRLCGLPDVSAYIARRELARMGKELREGFRRFGEAWAEAAEQALPGLRAIREVTKPKQAPPIWADNPAGQRRPTKTRNHRRVK